MFMILLKIGVSINQIIWVKLLNKQNDVQQSTGIDDLISEFYHKFIKKKIIFKKRYSNRLERYIESTQFKFLR